MGRKIDLFKYKTRIIIFGSHTFWGKVFDIVLLVSIILSVLVVMLESVESINDKNKDLLIGLEWGFTIIFTIEYFARIAVIERPKRYVFSFFGIVDLLSIIPTYLSFFIVGAHSLMIIRSLRLFRVFRIFKLVRYLGEASQLGTALRASKMKIIVFVGVVLILVAILGTLMYLIEGGKNGFDSIPRSIYWAIVTLTTVGYGDIAPQTVLGQTIASFVMILGYGIIAVPTGIVTSEMTNQRNKAKHNKVCPSCHKKGHDFNAIYCKHCGANLG